ncbi:ABC transporter permease, partial [Candidatus Woesearchaeota archaeon]|nr:ABC transporter permease [Candidatus Woesearchaeota archaeon]
LVSFGQGLQHYLEQTAEKMGSDKLIVQAKGFAPPGAGGVSFSKEDLEILAKTHSIDESAGLMFAQAEVKLKDGAKPKFVYATGSPTGPERRLVQQVFSLELLSGRDIKKGDKLKAALGFSYSIPDKVFSKAINAGDSILINGEKVDVVGIYKSIGNPQDDSNAYLSKEGFQEIFSRGDVFDMVLLRTEKVADARSAADAVSERFRKHKGQEKGEEDFHVQTFEQIVETFGTVINVLNGVLVVIALISVLIAAINIMNTMYTAVLERTKEIGIIKAVGSKEIDIIQIFMVEAGFLGFVGGAFGVLMGMSIASLGGSIAKNAGLGLLQPVFPWWLIAGCLLFSSVIGAASGLLPSLQAARQNPVEALRYE